MEKYYIHVKEMNVNNEELLNELGVIITNRYESISAYAVQFKESRLEKIQELTFVSNIEKQGLDTKIIDKAEK